MKFHFKQFPWQRVIIVILASLVVGNATVTLILYILGHPQVTAWTGIVPQATPSAVNDFLLAISVLFLGYYIWHRK